MAVKTVTQAQTAREAAMLFGATIAVSMIGTALGIFNLFTNVNLTIEITTALLVGAIGIINFIRHSIFYRSDQVRMGWKQEHPEFQLKVGYANLALGLWALIAVALGWGAIVCGLLLAMYGTYLACTLLLHIRELLATRDLLHTGHRDRAVTSVYSTGFFVLLIFFFAYIALGKAGIVPSFIQ